jgi:hypothetical protein
MENTRNTEKKILHSPDFKETGPGNISGCPFHQKRPAEVEAQNALPEPLMEPAPRTFSRRTALKLGAVGLASLTTLTNLEAAGIPTRLPQPAPPRLPNIQYDLAAFIPPAQTIEGVAFRFGPVYTLFVTARLNRVPRRREQQLMTQALATVEDNYPFSPKGVFSCVAYGLPYFRRLPQRVVAQHMPRLLDAPNRFALEEAVPGPTDVSPGNPKISKPHFHVPVVIENNDLLFTFRSDQMSNLFDVLDWLQGSNRLNGRAVTSPAFASLFTVTSSRLMFVQQGLPRQLADKNHLPYAALINPRSPMWMGFADQQVKGSGPASITTFQGNGSARFTSTRPGDYFADGSIQHLAHDILDLGPFYEPPEETYTERVQYMFRSNPIPATGNPNDQFTNGGGPVFLDNIYQGTDDAERGARGINTFEGERRIGHLPALQRSSRAKDGTPIHIRVDGPGFDNLDVPNGTNQPKLQFSIYVPTAEFFRQMRVNAASLDLVEKYQVKEEDNGLERFMTATRRQNFLVPPRIHRAFPLAEFA